MTGSVIRFSYRWNASSGEFAYCAFDRYLCAPELAVWHNQITFHARVSLYPKGVKGKSGEEFLGHLGLRVTWIPSYMGLPENYQERPETIVQFQEYFEELTAVVEDFDPRKSSVLVLYPLEGLNDLMSDGVLRIKLGIVISSSFCEYSFLFRIAKDVDEGRKVSTISSGSDKSIKKSSGSKKLNELITNCVPVDDNHSAPTLNESAAVNGTAEKKIITLISSDNRRLECDANKLAGQSPYVAQILKEQGSDAKELSVPLERAEIRCVLEFVESGKLSNDIYDTPAEDILEAAALFQMPRLKQQVHQFLADCLHHTNVVNMLGLADTYDMQLLKGMCLGVLLDRVVDVMASGDGKDLDVAVWKEVKLLAERRQQVTLEPEVVEFV